MRGNEPGLKEEQEIAEELERHGVDLLHGRTGQQIQAVIGTAGK